MVVSGSGKRRAWTLVVTALLLFNGFVLARTSRCPSDVAAVWLLGVIFSASGVRGARGLPTGRREECDVGWARRVAIAVCIVATALPFLVYVLVLSAPNEAAVDAILVGGALGSGMVFGAMLGCGGVLAVREDDPGSRMSDSTSSVHGTSLSSR